MASSVRRDVNVPPFTYDEFLQWYSAMTVRYFEPARDAFERLTNGLLDAELSDIERRRIRVSSSRIKDAARVWAKLESDRYRSRVRRLADVLEEIDDIVGLRITCNNASDLDRVREIVAALPSSEDDNTASIATDPASEKPYHQEPKESGYRAYHINLVTLVSDTDRWVRMVGELQVRTLLQDGWGELTHEDTYKPGVELPPLARRIARRMADLLAAVDDLAQDLRDELERVADQSITDDKPSSGRRSTKATESVGREQVEVNAGIGEALVEETRRVVESLTKQAPLSQVAELVQANFGRGITNGWGGHGTFVKLVRSAVPDATILADRPPGYVVPPGVVPLESFPSIDLDDEQAVPEDFPPVLQRLHLHDRSLPQVSADAIAILVSRVSAALEYENLVALGLDLRTPGIRDTNALAKHIRDGQPEGPGRLSRSQVDYILKGLLFSGNLRSDISAPDVSEVLARFMFTRSQSLGLVTQTVEDRDAIRTWFGLAN